MPFKTSFTAALAVIFLTTSVDAEIKIHDAYGRVATPISKTGAMFMHIINHSDVPDRLLAASSPVAQKVEIHTHKNLGDGVMQMMEVEEGLKIPAGGMYMLKRGGDHVMFMGLNARWAQDDLIPVTLTFERAGDVTVEVIVDLEREVEDMDHANHEN